MYVILQEGVQAGVVDLAGYVIGIGGLALTAAWLSYLYR